MCDTELFYSVGIYYSEFKVKKNSGSSAAAAERKSGENRTCCGNQLGMILTYAHYSQLLRGVMIIFERLSLPLIIWYNLKSILIFFTGIVPSKGQKISELIYEVIVSPKIRTKSCQDFCPV